MKQYVYADNAATSKMDKEAYEAMVPYMLESYGNASQPYSFSRDVKKALKDARESIASCIGANPEEIYFTSGGTESDNWAIKGFCNKESEILTSAFEHHAVLNACADVEYMGNAIRTVRPNKDGYIEIGTFSELMNEKVGVASVMYANNEIGTIQPIAELADVAHDYGALFHTDAVQAVGHIGIDVHGLNVDLLSASAHKFNGPKGVGFLYIKEGTIGRALLNGGSQEQNMRAGTENIAAIVGMSKALENNCYRLKAHMDMLSKLETRLEEGLRERDINYQRNGRGSHLPGLISLSFPGMSGEGILHRMDLYGVAISTGSACDGEKDTVSHVLKAIELDDTTAKGTIRISLGKYNTEKEVDFIVESLAKICGRG